MPVSGNEETGVKPIARQSSDYIAGVPIKKRRFPLIRPPSPPPEETSLLPAKNDSVKKEHSSPSQGLVLSNASAAASSSGFSDANKNSVPGEKIGYSDATNVNMVKNITKNSIRVKTEEPSATIHPGSLADIDSKENLLVAEKSADILMNSAKTELKLATNNAPTLNVGKEIHDQQEVEAERKSEMSIISGNTELSLGLKEHLVSAMGRQNNELHGLDQGNIGPISLNLFSSESESSTQCKRANVHLNIDGSKVCANRSNWDLNTTMDAWEGPAGDAGAGQVTVDRLNTIGGTHDIKPLISSAGMVGTGESVRRSNFSISTTPLGQQYNDEDSLHLGLSPSCVQSKFSLKPLSAKGDSSRVIANNSLSKVLVPTGNLNMVNFGTVKAEPLDESIKHDDKVAKATPMGSLLDFRAVKCELVERCNLENLKSPNFSTLKLVDPRSIKSEPVHEANQETLKTIEATLKQSDKQMLQALDNRGIPTCSTGLFVSGDVSNSEQSMCNKGAHLSGEMTQVACGSAGQVSSETISASVGYDGNEANVSGMTETAIAEDKNVDNAEQCRLKFMTELPHDSRGAGEGSASDEEKINLSGDMLEDDSYSTDYESDGNHDLAVAMDTEKDGGEEDDYEDGEVREPMVHTTTEGPICEKREAELVNNGDSDNKKMDFAELSGDDHPTSSHAEGKDTKTEDTCEANNDNIKECVDTAPDEETNKSADKDACLQESTSEALTSGADKKIPIKATQRKLLDVSGWKDTPKCQETEQLYNQATNVSQGTLVTVAQGADENNEKTDVVENNDSALLKTEASLNGDDAAKDANGGGNRSRIINLARASNSTSPSKTRSVSGRLLLSRAERERLPDVALEGEKSHPRGRDEIYVDSSHKFSRDRHQDQSSRNSRLNFVHGRGRVSGRIATMRGDWDSERDFAPEFYNGPTDFRVSRHKYESAVANADLEFNSYNIGPDGAFVGTGRGGRKLLNDEAPVFRHLPSRRRSPGGRDGPPARSLQMVRGVPRNISPSRCIGEDGSELVGLRHGEKFLRGFPDDNTDPVFTRPHPQYEGLDGHFVRGNRNFPSVQRRGLPRIRSKSPVRSRTRSPGPWLSPRRRSPDGFSGHPELSHRRPSPIYRMERIRSPDHPCFPGEIVVRRHNSPPYLSRPSNELRDMDSGRDHGHLRSVIPNRSPSGRVLLRDGRRFDIVDPRERRDGDDYFGGPMHSGRFHELGGDGNGEERRRLAERRGPVRPFRPPYNGADGENFHLNTEDGPRPFRFCPEDDSEFHERGNLREREFDRRIKNRPGNVPRRMRTVEEQERNFRHGGQVWHDAGFDDISRVKRKRF